jgi:hypothetical protein
VDGAGLVLTWVGGIIGATFTTLGMIPLLTGRMVLNPGRYNWTAGEAKIHGLVMTTVGLWLAIVALVYGFGPSAGGPAWLHAIWWLWFPFAMALPTTTLLLEQHHHRRWPFVQRRLDPTP